MRPHAVFYASVLAVAFSVGCRDPQSPRAPYFATGKVRGGGFDNANNVGSIRNSNWPVIPWTFPANIGVQDNLCYFQGACAVGTIVNPDFSAADGIGAVLGPSGNPDPNPPQGCIHNDANSTPSPDCFALLAASNFMRDTGPPGVPLLIETNVFFSGIESTFPLDPDAGWVLSFDYAFMVDVLPGGNANAFVRLNDARNPGSSFAPLQVSQSDLEQGFAPVKSGGCGNTGLGGILVHYALCTGWQRASFDVSALAGKNATVAIYVNKGGANAAAFAIDNLTFDETVLVGAVSGPGNPVPVNTTVNVSTTFTDPEAGAVHTATIDWADGSSSAGSLGEPGGGAPGTVDGSHAYTAAGVYSVVVTVSDGSGLPGKGQFDFVVVFDPAEGFIVGQGRIDSPVKAYAPDTFATGKARFGFLSKYKKAGSVPSGNTAFHFAAGNLKFKSTGYLWLVVEGAEARFTGVGTINGAGDYGFQVTALDGQAPGGGGTDKFRIKIWDRATSQVVYDTQMRAANDADPTTRLRAGRIVLHKPKK